METCTVAVTSKTASLVALIDAADYDELSQYSWSAVHGYASRNGPGPNGRTTIYMHRQILGMQPGDGLQADHINRNRLDNRRSNLRVATHALNAHNQMATANGTSRYRGVSWSRLHRKWRATVQLNRKVHHVGLFADEVEAAQAAATFRASHMSHANN